MPVQISPPAKNTRSQRNPVVLTPTTRVPLDCTPTVHQLSSEGATARLGEVEDEDGEDSVEEGDSGETEVADDLKNAPEIPQGSNLSPTNHPLVSQSYPSLLKIMEQMATITGKLSKAEAPRDNSKAPVLKNLSIKALDPLYGTQTHKLRGFIQSCQLIFHNYPENFFSDRKKVLYSTSFLTGKAGK
ncbi:hypothetical protein O181_051776 [Austropuccinia psidii MF-1]|uniref:Uncharacterized protein n=1 Tax=Austropuccinia psidii MF-1 TaxID=1389203 RepID=A0A9Q3E4C8_9BASI|nr:hypothetical protein [Austropuccinia psidii MF-1]